MAEMNDPNTSRYMTMAAAQPKLSLEEELELARAYQERGDQQAKDRLVTANLRHVIPLALKYRVYGASLADLIAEGNLALVKSLDRFEPSRGLRFVTYAKFWVRAEMLALVMRQRSLVGGGRGHLQPKFFFRLRRDHTRLQALLGDERQVVDLLAEKFRKSPEEIEIILGRLSSRDASLDNAANDNSQAPIDMLQGDLDQEKAFAQTQMRTELAVAIRGASDDFSERERYIIDNRLMADREHEKTLSEIGATLGISRERARQIELRIKNKLRKRLLKFAPVDAAA
jgi:RNA polymerase sigma-32 factor